MNDFDARLKALEVQMKDAESEIDELYALLKEKTNEDSVRVISDGILNEKKYITVEQTSVLLEKNKDKMEAHVKDTHFNLIKWVIGTWLSTIGLVLGIIKFFS